MASKVTKIPMKQARYYDNQARQCVYIDGVYEHCDYEGERAALHIDNIPFEDKLTYKSYYRGRSAAGMVFANDRNQNFTVFLTDFEKMIPKLEKGVIEGKFIYCKRGRSYGLKLYEE